MEDWKEGELDLHSSSGESTAVGRLLSQWSSMPEQVLEGKSAWESLCSNLREKMVCGMGTTCTCHENAVQDSERLAPSSIKDFDSSATQETRITVPADKGADDDSQGDGGVEPNTRTAPAVVLMARFG